MHQSIPQTLSHAKTFIACLLSFMLLITPITALAATAGNSPTVREGFSSSATKAKTAESELFLNQPVEMPALPTAQPEPAPEPMAPPVPIVGSVTATMSAALTVTANNGDGKADPGDTINYTVQLGNTSGSDGTGITFSDTIDTHTTLVGGTLNSTPVAFDQTGANAVVTNEDNGVSVTIQGQDPDGSNLTFTNISSPPNGSFGSFSAPSCVSGICSSTATYTPNANFFGADSFTFKVNDGTSPSNETGTVSITVNAVNDAPTFTVPGNPAATNEDAGAISVPSFITAVRPAQAGNTTEDSQTVSFVVTNNTNPTLFSSGPALNVAAPTGPFPTTATLTYTSALNQNGTAVITYHAHDNGGTANSGVDNSADQTFTITVNAVNDPPVVVGPAAFAAQANMKRTGLTGLLGNVNDNADNGVNGCVSTSFTVTNVSATSPAGGNVTITNASTGAFDFDPPAGVTGAVTFTYTVTDTGCPGPGVASSPATTVTVNVAGPVIWFVNLGAVSNGDGRLSSPFNLLSSANTKLQNLGANERIFLYSTTANTTAAINDVANLQSTQGLIGQGAIAADFDTLFGITPPSGTIARPSINGTRPTVRGTVTMRNNTVVRGVNIDVSAAAAGSKGLASASFTSGTSAVSDVNVTSAAGNAVDFSGTQTISYTTSNSSTSPNILSSTSATALSVVNTTIGASGLTFRSISAGNNTAAADPANGIVLNNTGGSGSLVVQGDGNTSLGGNNSGGVIQHTTSHGISLTNTFSPSFVNMSIHDIGNNGINGTSVTNFTFDNGQITNTGTAVVDQYNESAIAFVDPAVLANTVSGNLIITDSLISGARRNAIMIETWNGTIANVNISNNTVSGPSIASALKDATLATTADVQDGIHVFAQGSASTTANLTTGTINNNTISGFEFFSNPIFIGGNGIRVAGGSGNASNATTGTLGAAATPVEISGNDVDNVGSNAIAVSFNGVNGLSNFNIHNNGTVANPMSNAEGLGISVFFGGSGTFSGLVSNNAVNNNGPTVNAGSAGIAVQADDGPAGLANSTGVSTIHVNNNTITNPDGFGIRGIARASSCTLNLYVQNNDVGTPRAANREAIRIDSGSSAGDTTLNLNMTGNSGPLVSTTDLLVGNGIDAGVGVRKQGTVAGTNEFNIQGISAAPTNAQVQAYLGSPVPPGKNYTAAAGGAAGTNANGNGVDIISGSNYGTTNAVPLLAAPGGVEAAQPSAVSVLTQAQLDLLVAAAIGRWKATGLSAEQIGMLRSVRFEIVDLPGVHLGEADGNRVLVDSEAGGRGWFVDPNPLVDSNFACAFSATRLYTDSTNAPAGHIDLLTALEHEMGHKLGLDDSYLEKDRDSLMYGYLTVGERRLPSNGQAKFAHAEALTGSHFLSLARGNDQGTKQWNHARSVRRKPAHAVMAPVFAPVPPPPGTITINGVGSGFKLPNGKTITIKFSVTLNNPPNLSGVPPATPQVSTQGTLTGGFIGNPIVTDDPSTVAANDATVTLVDLFDTTTTLGAVPAAGSWNVGQSVTFMATVASNPAGNPTAVSGSVIFKDNGTAISGCNPVALSSAQAQCVTTFGSGAHSVTAVYSGDGNFDPSTSSALSQGAVNQSGTATAVTSSLNPSLVTQSVTFTATVTSTTGFAGPPTGTVQFKDNLVNLGSAQTLNGSGVATLITSALIAGNHPITAVYSGDTNFNTSTGTLTGDPQVVNKSNTTTLLASSSNPVAPTVEVTYTATVSSATAVTGPPTGTVTFNDGANPITCSNAGGQTLSGGVATCKFTYPDTVGSPHDISAVYGGDTTFNGNTSNHVSEVIQSCSASVVVTSNADSGANTLRDAINTGVCAGGTITFDPAVTSITLTSGELAIGKNMTITGPGAASLTISGNNASRVFNVANGNTVIISGMTINGGKVAGSNGAAGSGATGGAANGGGVFNAGTLTLSNVILSGNNATGGDGGSATGSGGGVGGNASGGGVYSTGTLTLTNTTISGNNTATGGKGGNSDTANGSGGSAFGGGVYSSGTLTLTNTTVASNTVNGGVAGAGTGAAGVSGTSSGGGIYNDGASGAASATISGSTISGNTAGTNGGGIFNTGAGSNATLTLSNSTISGNTANNDGGGIYNSSATGTATLTSVTVTGNRADKDDDTFGAGGGINVVSGTFTLKNTIVAGNLKGTASPTAHDIAGTINTTGSASTFNLIGDAASSGTLTDGVDNNIVGNAGVGTIDIATVLNTTLADNGGPTKTHALVNNSPALEKGKAFSLTTDQRGFPRPVDSDTGVTGAGDESDIGAFEKQIAPNAPGAPNLDAVSDSGANSADDKTNVTTNLSFTIPGVVSGATVQLFRDGTPVASGLASGATIQLTDPGPLTFTASGTVYSYTAKQSFGTDTSVASTALPVTITIIPDAPVLDPASDSGTLGDGITNDTSPTFDITNVVNTATVKLFRDGVEVASGTAAGTTIQLTDPSAPNGTFTYTAKQIFNAVTSDASAGTSITITIKPDAPDLDAASDTGILNTDNYTADSTPTFNLTGVVVGANVELLRDGTSVANNASAGSTTIQLTDPGAADGMHTYKVRQTVGVTLSPDSDGLDVIIDTVNNPPSTPDLLASSDSNINNDNVTNINTPTFSGTAEANSTVRLFANAVLKGTTAADNAGAWTITSTTLPDNSYSITANSTDIAGNLSSASIALNPVVIDTAQPTVAMTSGVGNPTATTPIPVTVTFNESVTGFTIGDIVPGNGTVGNFAGGPAVYTFDLTPTSAGAVSADIAAGAAIDLAGNSNTAATQFNRTFDPSALSATITPVSPDPRNTSVSSIQIVFNKAVTGFDLPDLTLKLNGGANLLTGAQTLTSGDNITWTLGNLSGLTGTSGTYVLKLTAAGSNIKDAANNPLTGDATETWVVDTTPLTVTVNQAAGQSDPVTGPIASTVINFTAVFNKPVADFTNSDVTIGGTAGATVANVSQIAPNDGTTYNVAIEGMTGSGTVIASILANQATDNAGNLNTASTSIDNTVTFFKDDFTTFVVNSTADTDDGPCSPIGTGNGCTLREAINAANADAGLETITFDPNVFGIPGPHVISLLTALPSISTDMTIQGTAANVVTVERNSGAGTNFRIFNITAGTVIISGLTITKGVLGASGQGGGIFNGGTLTLNNNTISLNQVGTSGLGGGVYNSGTLTISGNTINGNQVGNSGSGGGIYNPGTMTINNSTISGNSTGSSGSGGGIFSLTNTLTINGSTITGNLTGAASSGGGIFRSSGTVTLKNTIVGGGNTAATGPDISGTVQSDGFNLIQSTSGATINANPGAGPNITGQDPKLDPNGLQDNGGPTKTFSLQCTSPAIDKGFKFGLSTDQRGGTRPFDLADSVYPNAVGGDGSDIGAYETQSGGGCLPLAVTPATQVTDEDTPGTFTLTGTFSQNATLTFTISQAPTHGATGTPSAANCTFTTFTTCTSTVVYTPSPNYNGPDFFKFIVSAGPGLDSDPADVNVTVNPVNDPPVALFDGYSTPENTLLTVAAPGVLTNDSDIDSPTLTAVLGTGPSHAASFALNANGSFSYTPVHGFTGNDTFTYRAFDGALSSNLATVTITVNEGGAIHFTSLTYSVIENGSDAVIDVVRTGGSAGIATAVFTATDGTATVVGGDYTSVTQTVTFNDGETAKQVHVPITEDFINEPDETVNLTLGSPGGSGDLIAPNAAVLTIVNDDPTGGYIQFNSATYTVAENAGSIDITVKRIGTTTLPVTVHYATSDMTASERSDYTTTLGTLSFAAGENTKTFTVLVNQDAFVEGSELLGLTLTNAAGGATLGVPQNATLQINDSLWTPPPANAIDDAGFFVRQHYHDFLNREPDAAGLAFWTDQITSCGSDAACIDIRRINVSAAFFLSIEYQETGFVAFLANRAAFGPTLPRYRGFVEDTQALQRGFIFTAPGSAAVLEANKVAYFNDFVLRPDFVAIYGALSNAQYVDTLIANTGATFTTAERDALVNGLNNATETRATVLRKITEKPSFKASQFNRAFVLMQYFGYLRRNPDDAPDNNLDGFNFWLNKLNQFNGNFVQADMVKAFIVSGEYRGRFGN